MIFYFRIFAERCDKLDDTPVGVALIVESDDYDEAIEVVEEYTEDIYEQRVYDLMVELGGQPEEDEYENDDAYWDAMIDYENKVSHLVQAGWMPSDVMLHAKFAEKFGEDYVVAQDDEEEN